MTRIHLIVVGRVQGVFFRQSTKNKASSIGVKGWVRNRSDGTVEIVAEGTSTGVDQLAEWCNQGPEMAKVERMERVDEAPVGLPEGFHVRPTL